MPKHAKPNTTTGTPQAAENTENTPTAREQYTPIFNNTTRTAIYVITLIATITSVALHTLGYTQIATLVTTISAMLSSGFGVAYNPTRLHNQTANQ